MLKYSRRIVTTGFVFIFIGVVTLTVSRSGPGFFLKGRASDHKQSNSAKLEPPIYPTAGEEISAVCNVSFTSSHKASHGATSTTIFIVTPTYSRREQIAELTRLGQTLLNVDNVHWVVSEDSEQCSPMIEALLRQFGMPYTHIISPMPKIYNSKSVKYKPRGVSSRRAAMQWIVKNWKGNKSVLYFADDDNTYDLQIFEEIRGTQKVSVFPVGFIGSQSISSPLVEDMNVISSSGDVVSKKQVVGFTDDWFASRKYPLDMAGFAVDIGFLVAHPNATMPYKAGYEEDYFLQSLNVTLEDLEPLADGCSKVLVWHTQTEKKKSPLIKLKHMVNKGNLFELMNDLIFKGVVKVSPAGKELKICKRPDGCD